MSNFLLLMFRPHKIETKPTKEYEKFYDPEKLLQKFPIITKEYDVSPLRLTGVNATLEVTLVPNDIQLVPPESDEPFLNSFYLMFRLKISNPQHCDANNFLEMFFYVYASRIIKYSSSSIAYAFNKLIGFDVAEKKT